MKKQLIIAAIAISIMFAVSCGPTTVSNVSENTDSVSIIESATDSILDSTVYEIDTLN
jgi:PBP1b-binding outer membrane lipoprotein LpoB